MGREESSVWPERLHRHPWQRESSSNSRPLLRSILAARCRRKRVSSFVAQKENSAALEGTAGETYQVAKHGEAHFLPLSMAQSQDEDGNVLQELSYNE